jgi:hypothetical protein
MNLNKRGSVFMIRDKDSIDAVKLLRYGDKFNMLRGKPIMNIKSIASACGISASSVSKMLK